MTIDEIYAKIAQHMIKGIMLHDQLAVYYKFLGMNGYSKHHEMQANHEMNSYRRMNCYFINNHNRLIPELPVASPKAIPESWYSVMRDKVDDITKRKALEEGIKKWVDWERETKELYKQMYDEANRVGSVSDLVFIKWLHDDVTRELSKAEVYYEENAIIYTIPKEEEMAVG